MNLFKCRECGVKFESRRALHAHLKAHKIKIKDYYVKHFPRVDLLTHKPIVFKDVKQYLTSDFNRADNLKKWLEKQPDFVARSYLAGVIKQKLEDRTKYMMGEVQLLSYNLPSVNQINNCCGSFEDFCKEVGYPPQFPDEMPLEYTDDHSGLTILVDTREQKPLKFRNMRTFGLDFGDYTLGGNDYDYTYVERKSVEDFVNSMNVGFDRINEEIERAKTAGCYIFFVVDGHMDTVQSHLIFKNWRSEMSYQHIMHNMREILRNHAGHCQFVFSGGRKKSEEIIPKLLYCGRRIWGVDVQNYLNHVD